MGEKDDGFLGLNLSLGIGDSEKQRKQNNDLVVMSLASQHMQSNNHHQNNSLTDLFLGRVNGGARMPVAPGLDMNIAPSSHVHEYDEEAGVSSPNSTVSSISAGKKMNDRDPIGDEIEAERASSSRGSDDEDGGDASRKKLRLSKEQSLVLEETFKEQSTLNPKQKLALANQLNLRPRQVEVWFQNRRARTKLKQTEVDCEYLKQCCENLTEENRRLQKEVQELRALKLSPQLYMQMNPPTTLTMCPSCERVAPSRQQPMPSNPWGGAMAVHRRDAPASRS